MTVDVMKESETKTTYSAEYYELRRVTEKTLDRIAEDKVELHEVVARRARLKPKIEIPEFNQLAAVMVMDLEELRLALGQAVAARRKEVG